MTPTPNIRPAWRDRGLVRSNPVYAAECYRAHLDDDFEDPLEGPSARSRFAGHLRVMARYGGRVPDSYVDGCHREGYLPTDFRLDGTDTPPRVFGLAVDRTSNEPFVVPLRPDSLPAGAEWDVDPTLPFDGGHLEDGLVRVARAVLPAGVIPERLAYRFRNPLGRDIGGDSMTVAAVLAVLDSLSGGTDERLRAAVSLVAPEPDGAFVGVRHAATKLRAAVREHGTLTLALVPPDFEVPEGIDARCLGHIQPIGSYAELAAWLGPAVTDPLLTALSSVLTRADVSRLRDLVRRRVDQAHLYTEAAALAGRLLAATTEPVSAAVWADIRAHHVAAARHGGRFTDAIRYADRIVADVTRLRDIGAASDDEVVYAMAEREAGVFDAHGFGRINDRLAPLLADVADPRRFRPITRVMVWNTLGRTWSVLGRDGWEPLFRQSAELLGVIDPTDVPRTLCYLIRGLLRAGRTTEARAELDALGIPARPESHSQCELIFLRADLARRTGERWEHPALERTGPGPNLPGYVLAFYFQATARQSGRTVEETRDRLTRAIDFLDGVTRGDRENVCTLFADCLRVSRAACPGDAEEWRTAIAAVRTFLAPTATATVYYRPVVEPLSDAPSLSAAERLLNHIPYF